MNKGNKLLYIVLRGAVYLLSLLPFRVLYLLSDMMYVIVYYVVRYRRKVVRSNLTTSFPEKSPAEIKRIERGFYHYLCDYINETLKLLSISRKELLRHLEFRNADQVAHYFNQGRSCAGILGHFGNWEWLSATGLAFDSHPDAVMGLIYHPLYSSKALDQLFIDIRQRKGGVCIKRKEILRRLVEYRREGRLTLFGYIADQSPKWQNIHLWLDFLNHDTPVFTGAERIMRKMDNAVFYIEMMRERRGHYVCTFHLLADHPQELPEHELTRRFFVRLEQSIRLSPATYLWTHKRWKRTYEEYVRRMEAQTRSAAARQEAAAAGNGGENTD